MSEELGNIEEALWSEEDTLARVTYFTYLADAAVCERGCTGGELRPRVTLGSSVGGGGGCGEKEEEGGCEGGKEGRKEGTSGSAACVHGDGISSS